MQQVVEYRDVKAALKSCLLLWKANLLADSKSFRVFQHGPNPRSSQHVTKDIWCRSTKKGRITLAPLLAVFYLLPKPGLVSESWARGYFVSGLVEALAQAIPFRVQHHSKPRFGWAVAQEKSHCSKGLCLLWDVAAHAVHGIAWDVGVDFWGTCLWRKDCVVFV